MLIITIAGILVGISHLVHAGQASKLVTLPTSSKHTAFLVFLGTGTPSPNPQRQGPSLAVVANGKAYFVDAGVGLVRQSQAAVSERTIGALALEKLEIAFLTHLHSDHTLGLADLIFSPWPVRTAPLQLYGPVGTKSMAKNIEKAYAEDIYVRTHGPNPLPDNGHQVIVHEIHPGVVYSDENVRVTAFAVHHGIWKEALGYRFDAEGESIVFSGDTSPTQSVVDACNRCDILVHEVYAGDVGTPSRREYLSTFHTSAEELGEIAAQAHPKLLALTHILPMAGTDEAQLLGQIRQKYQGSIVVANDLDVISP